MKRTVMVVDDSPTMRQVLRMALAGEQFQIIEAVDGVDALEKAEGTRLHLVISDVNMPRMDGLSFVEELKRRPAHKFVPVIMLTTETSPEMKLAGKAAGAKAWVVKPFPPAQMIDAVRKLVLP